MSDTAHGLGRHGFRNLKSVNWNLGAAALYEEAVRRGEGHVAKNGPLVVRTGIHTGRSAGDKFVVRDDSTESQVWWDNNKAMSPAQFDALYADMMAHAEGRELFAKDLFGGADLTHRISVRVVTEYAWHSLFVHQLLIRPTAEELKGFDPEFTIIDLPSFNADPARHGCVSQTVIAVNFAKKVILIGGTSYAGEMKKSVFTIMNYLLPSKRVMSMHCSANVGANGESAIFFGLSGTGKTTLSADPDRALIGDDEHGWAADGVFNFEGGCYAKAINLSAEQEPDIFATTQMFGTVLENVVLDDQRRVQFEDQSITENTRASYPLHYIRNHVPSGRGGHPKHVVFLTADAFGVLPPIAKLSPEQAMYYFLSGYTAKVAGTETGVNEPQATFSACFGAVFMVWHPTKYADMLGDLLTQHHAKVWLVNTGWSGGAYGTGKRMKLAYTRSMVRAALAGALDDTPTTTDAIFGLAVPTAVAGVPAGVLDARGTWSDPAAYDAQARKLAGMFRDNFAKFGAHVADKIVAAGPKG